MTNLNWETHVEFIAAHGWREIENVPSPEVLFRWLAGIDVDSPAGPDPEIALVPKRGWRLGTITRHNGERIFLRHLLRRLRASYHELHFTLREPGHDEPVTDT